MVARGLIGAALTEVPVEPDAPEARRWLIDELSKSEYQNAQPTLLDRIATGFLDWFESLRFDGASGPPAATVAIVVGLVVVAIIVAFLVFGLPRLNRRSRVTGMLFGEQDDRTARAMRTAAERAAGAGDYALAIAELYRAIARSLAERTLVIVAPGTTALGFAHQAGLVFPAQAAALTDAAAVFDDVRYLGGSGSREQYEALRSMDTALLHAAPAFDTAGMP
jgi:hypothetical protein